MKKMSRQVPVPMIKVVNLIRLLTLFRENMFLK